MSHFQIIRPMQGLIGLELCDYLRSHISCLRDNAHRDPSVNKEKGSS